MKRSPTSAPVALGLSKLQSLRMARTCAGAFTRQTPSQDGAKRLAAVPASHRG